MIKNMVKTQRPKIIRIENYPCSFHLLCEEKIVYVYNTLYIYIYIYRRLMSVPSRLISKILIFLSKKKKKKSPPRCALCLIKKHHMHVL